MIVYRCDECCDVLGDIDDGVVYDCDKEVESKLGVEHLCKDCLDSSEELYLCKASNHTEIVKLIDKE